MFWEDIEPVITDRLAETVDQSYKVFVKYQLSGTLEYCNCNVCMTDEQAAQLSSLSLKNISSKLLAEYTNSAHADNEPQFKYFLPRYFDLIARCDPPTDLGLETCLNRLGSARYREKWPSDETQMVDEFFDAFMEASLNQLLLIEWPAGLRLEYDIGEVLCMVVLTGGDIDRVLDVFERCEDPEAAVHMGSLRRDVRYRKGAPQYLNAHLEDFQPDANRIGEWLMRDAVTERIKTAKNLLNDPNYDDVLSFGL